MTTKLENDMIQAEIQKKLTELEEEFLQNSEKGYKAKVANLTIVCKQNAGGKYIKITQNYDSYKSYPMKTLTVLYHSKIIKKLLINRGKILEQFNKNREIEYNQAKDIFESIGVVF